MENCEDEMSFEENSEAYKREAELALTVIRRNRHSVIEPFRWYGPDPEPNPPGSACKCGGCYGRFLDKN